MEQELIQAAISTFCTAPDLYQKIFQQMDVNFPDELVQAISDKPKEAVQMVQQNKELLNNIVTIYQQYGDQINQVIQQRTGMFAKGGKLNYLVQKYQNAAGNLPKKDNTFKREIRDFGDTTDTKIYNYRTDYRKTYPNGSVIMQRATPSDMSTYYDPRRPKPSF